MACKASVTNVWLVVSNMWVYLACDASLTSHWLVAPNMWRLMWLYSRGIAFVIFKTYFECRWGLQTYLTTSHQFMPSLSIPMNPWSRLWCRSFSYNKMIDVLLFITFSILAYKKRDNNDFSSSHSYLSVFLAKRIISLWSSAMPKGSSWYDKSAMSSWCLSNRGAFHDTEGRSYRRASLPRRAADSKAAWPSRFLFEYWFEVRGRRTPVFAAHISWGEELSAPPSVPP